MENRNIPLPQAKITELKSLIDSHLRSQNIYGQIRDFVRQAAKGADPTSDDNGSNQTVVLDALREKGVIEEVIKSIKRPRNLATPSSLIASTSDGVADQGQLADLTPIPSPFRRFLHLRINGGRAFVDHLATSANDEMVGKKAHFVLFVHFRNQRFRSRAVEVSVEPQFDESLLLDLQPPESTSLIDLSDVLKIDGKIHLVLARIITVSALVGEEKAVVEDKEVELVASYDIEWKNVLSSGGMSIPAELLGAGSQAKIKVPVGVLDMRLDIVPLPETSVKAADIARGLRAKSMRKQELQRQFFQYSRVWWKEYIDISPTFKNRLVKIFAEDEWGGHKPVCYFVQPLRAGRVLDSPRHAARFVSLIPYTKIEAVGAGAGRAEIWHTFHTFLSMRKGDCEDHAVLLCSLLLGFGLDSYVCIGTVIDNNENERDHLWVMTRSAGRGKSSKRIVFWESLTGQRYPHRIQGGSGKDDKLSGNSKMPKYGSIGCCFNHKNFYANKQASDAVSHCNFKFEDNNLWKSMDTEILMGIEHQEQVPLCPSTVNHLATEEALERALRPMISDYRRSSLRLGTPWDNELSYLLTPALAAYEMERLAGTPFGNEEFQQSIKRNVPEGHTFRGYPIVVNQRSPTRIMESFRRAQIASEILSTRGDQVHFALRVKIFTYPEDVSAVWVMLAVKFKPN